jgi:cobalamin biosynthesis protein CbiG
VIALGVGLSSSATAEELLGLADTVLSGAGLSRSAIDLVGTVDRLLHDSRVQALQLEVRGFTRKQLAQASDSVCEGAALLAVAAPARLLVAKVKGRHTTVAVACSATAAVGPEQPPERKL